jgi:UDP-hydrolysing UDP-N-acetyl-D-glucosamine 2-epimerase
LRTIGVVTTSRADYGIYRPLLSAIEKCPDLELRLMVSGSHLSPEFGRTVTQIEEDGFKVSDRVECLLSSDSGEGVSLSMGLGLMGFARALSRPKPDMLVVLGDRYEMFAPALAALPLNIPVVHLFGGELSLGAIDDCIRHALTKLSHLHFVATEEYAQRVIQLGEDPWRVTVCGALSLDDLNHRELLSRAELAKDLGLPLEPAPLLVTYHPVTQDPGQAGFQTQVLLQALEEVARPTIFTMPNADAGGREVAGLIQAFTQAHDWANIRDNLGTKRYFSLMAVAGAMVGNSSSGIIEAPHFRTPVVNVGNRQDGRVRAANVVDVQCTQEEIVRAVGQALKPGFRDSLKNMANPYGGGGVAEIITGRLSEVEINRKLRLKNFYDLERFGQG